MSGKSGFLFEPSFRTESLCGTGILCGWEGHQRGIVEGLRRKLQHLRHFLPHPILMKGGACQHHQDSRDRLSDSIPEKAAQHCKDENILLVLVEWST